MKPKQVSGDRFAGNLRPMQKALCAAFVAAALAAPAAAVAAGKITRVVVDIDRFMTKCCDT